MALDKLLVWASIFLCVNFAGLLRTLSETTCKFLAYSMMKMYLLLGTGRHVFDNFFLDPRNQSNPDCLFTPEKSLPPLSSSSASPAQLVHLFRSRKILKSIYIWILTTISKCSSESNFLSLPTTAKMNCDINIVVSKLLIHLGSLVTTYNFRVHWIFLSCQFTQSLCAIKHHFLFSHFLN